MKVAAIVPAYNEAGNVGNVLKALLSSDKLDEVILVDDGSKDKTSEVGRAVGAKVVQLEKNGGKGNAMIRGVASTDADVIVFFDADLISLSPDHVPLLINPIASGEAKMCVGIRGRLGGLPKLLAKISPTTFVIGGERAMTRALFENLPPKFIQGFAVEIASNYFCKANKLPVKLVELKGLKIIVKEKKWGFWKGFANRIKMIWQLIKIRIKILIFRKQFKTKNNV